MKRYFLFLLLGLLGSLTLNACAANKAAPLDAGFWNDRQPVVGVALASLPEPDVTVKISSTTPFTRQKTLIMSHRYGQDFDEEPYILKDQRDLWNYLNSYEVKSLTGLKDIFTRGLTSRGFCIVTIDEDIDLKGLPRYTPPSSGHARKAYRGIPQADGLDLLIVLNVKRDGTCCGYLDDHNIYSDVTATLSGEMIDLRTNRLLWRSTYRTGRVTGSSSSRCDDPDTYPRIRGELGSALVEAAGEVANDFFSGASN